MLWLYIAFWALGAWMFVGFVAMSLAGGGRKALLGLLGIVGLALIFTAAMIGQRHDSRIHGRRIDIADAARR